MSRMNLGFGAEAHAGRNRYDGSEHILRRFSLLHQKPQVPLGKGLLRRPEQEGLTGLSRKRHYFILWFVSAIS